MTTTDVRGKTIRVGDTVHKAASHRTIKRIDGDTATLRDTGRPKHTVLAETLIKE